MSEGHMSSLLMQAARSAAIADGVLMNDSTPGEGVDDERSSSSKKDDTACSLAALTSSYNKHGQRHAVPSVANLEQNSNLSFLSSNTSGKISSTAVPIASHMNMNAMSMTKPMNSGVNITVGGGGGGKKKGPTLRRGKWTSEEEAYANRLIIEFKAGLLPLTDGTTLRTFLSKLLNCDPMRISKKFVGGNCIGKQVFRRRTADINRLTPEQIHQSRMELSELERRFLERVAQTNRVKSTGGNNSVPPQESDVSVPNAIGQKMKSDIGGMTFTSIPPWLRPPQGFVHGNGQIMAQTALSNGNRAAMAGRLLLSGGKDSFSQGLSENTSANLLAVMEEQHRLTKNIQPNFDSSASNLLAALNASGSNSKLNDSSSNSLSSLIMKSGLSRDQLNDLVRARSKNSLIERQGSLEALMSLDFQSLQSIDNLANLIQNGMNSNIPRNGIKNWTPQDAGSEKHPDSSNNVSNLANARRLASEGRMENLIRSLSNGNVRAQNYGDSNANFNSLLQSIGDGSNSNLLDHASALNLANMLRVDSSTGLSALRMQDGLNHRNNSVDDFLSLVASGDIPHQDPHMLNMPLQSVLQHQNNASAASILAQQQHFLAQTGKNNNINLSKHFSSLNTTSNNISSTPNASSNASPLLSGFANNGSVASLLQHYANSQGSNAATVSLLAQQNHHGSNGMSNQANNKRKFNGNHDENASNKR